MGLYRPKYMEDLVGDAFAKLESQGIFARQNFWCCQNCGTHDIPDGHEGYAFYHAQGYDRLLEGGDLILYYGTEDGEGAKAIGERVAEALQSVGLEVEWDGDPSEAICVRKSEEASGDLLGRFNHFDDDEDDEDPYEDMDDEED